MLKTIKKIIPPDFFFRLQYHKTRAILAAYRYRFPSRKMTVIGVTGTDGKTTTCNMLFEILRQAGHKPAMASTINFRIGEKEWRNETKKTTLAPKKLQKFIRQAVDEKCDFLIVETSSHALSQNRVWGIDYDTAVITNTSHEHLDYHRTMDRYRREKRKLFEKLARGKHKSGVQKLSILNVQDETYEDFRQVQADAVWTYGLGDEHSRLQTAREETLAAQKDKPMVSAKNSQLRSDGSSFVLTAPTGEIAIDLWLPGEFNIENALCAATVGLAQGVDLATIKEALGGIKVMPGRMENIDMGQKFAVILDYAVTPKALEKLYSTMSKVPHGKIIAVLGACGDRDKKKRPVMGELAAKYCDLVIFTDEDPYTEDPQRIIDMLISKLPDIGKQEGKDYLQIIDRRQAIARALSEASEDDIVLITGKGDETGYMVGDKILPWDEREIVREELGKIVNSGKYKV